QEPVTLASLGWQTSAGALYVPADDGLHHPWAPPGAIASLREVLEATGMDRRHFVILTGTGLTAFAHVPSYYPELGAPCLICIDPQRRDEWLDAVYSDQTLITKVAFGFVVQWHLPDVTLHPATEDGQAGVHLRALDGSRASIYAASTPGGFPVRQAGPRQLWDQVEQAHTFWRQAGCPSSDRFGITATATKQEVW
ncbi:MAG: hypothetical protein ACRDRX_14055, partial [Pseudonocardiaceae bacterium]